MSLLLLLHGAGVAAPPTPVGIGSIVVSVEQPSSITVSLEHPYDVQVSLEQVGAVAISLEAV